MGKCNFAGKSAADGRADQPGQAKFILARLVGLPVLIVLVSLHKALPTIDLRPCPLARTIRAKFQPGQSQIKRWS